jgi:hypothetical protein
MGSGLYFGEGVGNGENKLNRTFTVLGGVLILTLGELH